MQTVIALVSVSVMLVTPENNVTHVTSPIFMALFQIVKVGDANLSSLYACFSTVNEGFFTI